MHLVWLSVNSSYSHSSLALPILQLAAQHVDQWEWTSLDTTIAEHPGELALRLEELHPDLLCTTLYLFNSLAVFEILERFKTLCPTCPVTIGGPECLGEGAEKVLRRSWAVDCAVSGEGEECLPKIMAAIAEHRFPEPLPGTACRLGQSIQSFAKPPLLYPDWEKAPAPVLSPFFVLDKPFVQMETTRGCPHGCVYCTSCRTPVRSKTLDQVRQELNLLSGKGVQKIRLLDRTFNLPAKRAANLLQLFRCEFPLLHFHLEIHPQYLNTELRGELQLARQGQLHIEAGIQSLKPEVLQAIGRNGSAEQALDGLRFLCSCHPAFDTHADLLAGLPKQNYQDLLADLNCLIAIGPAEIQLEILKVLPGTPLQNRTASLEILFNPNPPYEVLRTPEFPARELYQASLLSRMIDLFYNQQFLQEPFQLACLQNPDFLCNFLAQLIHKGFSAQWVGSLRKRFQMLADALHSPTGVSAASLAKQWIKAGLPLAETPFYRPEILHTLPKNAILMTGNAAACEQVNTRLWKLAIPAETFIFAFNRALCMQRPCTIWTIR